MVYDEKNSEIYARVLSELKFPSPYEETKKSYFVYLGKVQDTVD